MNIHSQFLLCCSIPRKLSISFSKCKYFGSMRTETYLYGYIAIGYGLVRYLKYFQYESWIEIAYPSPYSQIFMNSKTANMMGHL